MRSAVRFSILALVVSAIVAAAAPGAQAAIGIEKLAAVNCSTGHQGCAQTSFGEIPPWEAEAGVPKEPNEAESLAEGYVQAAGHVPYGITDFKLTTTGTFPAEIPTGVATHIRTDVPPGLATSPAAVPPCTMEAFGEKEALPETGFYSESKCSTESDIGEQKATVYAGPSAGDVPLEGVVYNLVQPEGLASDYGVALKLPKLLTAGALKAGFEKAEKEGAIPGVGGFPSLATQKFLEEQQYFAHTLIEGSVEWGQESKGTNQGDYHDYFEITVSPALPLIRSRLTFFGLSGNGAFITNATNCPGNLTTRLAVTGAEGNTVTRSFTSPIGLSGCGSVPFSPTFAIRPETGQLDSPDGLTAELGTPRFPEKEIDSAQLKTATITLPEGMTLNPSAAHGLAACTPAQARIHSSVKGTSCPAASEIGTVNLEVPTLPPGSLTGKIYLGGPESGPITGPPYTVYVDAETPRYGVSVRVKGEAIPNETTGRVTTVFSENPEQPFTSIALHFKTGALAPIANPLSCGTATTQSILAPYTGTTAQAPTSAFTVDSNGKGGGCLSPTPFTLTQGTANGQPNAGGHTTYSFQLGRTNGNQYLSQVKTTLPAGLSAAIPAVPLCPEPQAEAGTCPAPSQIGEVGVAAGAGSQPFGFTGPVYLTGPYHGAPYGLSIVVPAVAGPFNLGNVITRATINVDPTTARVTVASVLPTIVKGVPLRLRGLNVTVTKANYLFNPTNCGALATESTLISTQGAAQNVSSPFQVGNCSALKFKPVFKASSSAKTSKANGASLTTTITQPAGEANIKSVKVSLPKALPSRLTTLQKACTEAQFAADPFKCPSGSFVGGATVVTPTLPGKMTGPAILVSHGGAAFPDLDLVLQSNGIRIILTGNTDIKKGITTTTFATTPDVPVSSVTVNLPIGSHSSLTANTNLCANPLIMPTTIVGQNGATVTQNTRISVANCGVRVVGHKTVGNTAYLTIQTFSAGRISAKGSNVSTVFRRLSKAQRTATLKVPLSRGGRSKGRPVRSRIRVGFVPKSKKSGGSSKSFVTVSFH